MEGQIHGPLTLRDSLISFFINRPFKGYETFPTHKLQKLQRDYITLQQKTISQLQLLSGRPSTYKIGKKHYRKNKSHFIADIFNKPPVRRFRDRNELNPYSTMGSRISYGNDLRRNGNIIPDLHGFERLTHRVSKNYTTDYYENTANISLKNLFEAALYAYTFAENRNVKSPTSYANIKLRLGAPIAVVGTPTATGIDYKGVQLKPGEEGPAGKPQIDWIHIPFNVENINTPKKLEKFIDDLFADNRDYATFESDFYPEDIDIDPTIFNITILNAVAGGHDIPKTKCDKNRNYKTSTISDFLCINPRSNNNNCLIECFRYLTKNTEFTSSKIRKMLKIKKGIMLTLSHLKQLEEHFKTKIMVITGKDEHNELNILYGDKETCNYWLMFNDNHYSIVSVDIQVQLNKLQQKLDHFTPSKQRYFIYDYETVYDIYGELLPYSVVCIVYELVGDVFTKVHDFIDVGPNCSDKFVAQLMRWYDPDVTGVMIAYNASRFDHFLLAESLAKRDLLSPNSLFIANGAILQIRFLSYICMDLCKFTMQKLKDACDGYGCELNKLPFDHNIPQQHYFNGTFDKYLTDNFDEIVKYNVRDVEALADLFFKIRKESLTLLDKDITKFMTLNQMLYSKFRDTTPIDVCPPPKSRELFDFIRSSQIAGRSEIFRFGLVQSMLMSLDVKSLYPFVMLMCAYPIGVEIETDKYVPGKLGVYNVAIMRQPVCNIIPFRSRDAPLDWKYQGAIRCVLTSVDIDTLLDYNSEIIIGNGVYWENSSTDVFKPYLTPIKDAKTNQDNLKAAKDKSYNPALRSFAKSCANNLSGKVNQGIYDTDTKLCNNINHIVNFTNTHKNINMSPLSGVCSVFLSGTKSVLNYNPKNVKPCQLGVFIYSYARRHMYKSILSKVSTKCATDTDSCHIEKSEFDKLIQEPGFANFFMGGEFGDYENELKFITVRSYYVDPKCYGLFSGLCDCDINGVCKNRQVPDNKCCKMRFKGVSEYDKRLDIPIIDFERLNIDQKLKKFISLPYVLCEQLYKDLCDKKEVLILSSLIRRSIGVDKIAGLSHTYNIKSIKGSKTTYY